MHMSLLFTTRGVVPIQSLKNDVLSSFRGLHIVILKGLCFSISRQVFILKGGKFYRLVIVHYRRLHSQFAFASLLLKLKHVNKSLVIGQMQVKRRNRSSFMYRIQVYNTLVRPYTTSRPLQRRGRVMVSQAGDPGLIPGGVNYLLHFFISLCFI